MSQTILPSTADHAASSQAANTENGLQVELSFYNRSSRWYFQCQQGVKRLADILLASAGLLVLSPVLLVIAALIKITAPGPVMYKSLRIGKKFKPFYMSKFRTMQVNADSLRDQLRQENNLQGNLFKLSNDPRVTPIGRFLRAYSLDEFPQLLNVIRGEMSLVGPRPLPPDESALFENEQTLRFQVLPGVTGQWQVAGRSNLSFQQLCELEMGYTLRWNLLRDISILFKTVPAVLFSRGAC